MLIAPSRSHSINSIHGPVKSAWSEPGKERTVGGSSGGSALAVQTGQCFAWVLRRDCRLHTAEPLLGRWAQIQEVQSAFQQRGPAL